MSQALSIFFELARFSNGCNSSTIEELEATGCGLCGIQTEWFVEKCFAAGIVAAKMSLCFIPSPATPYGLGGGHTAACAYINGRWSFFDCSTGVAFLTPKGEIASWSEIYRYCLEYQTLPRYIALSKTLISTPDPVIRLSSMPCPNCHVTGIIETYYNVDNILQNPYYFMRDPRRSVWEVRSSYDNSFIRRMTPKELSSGTYLIDGYGSSTSLYTKDGYYYVYDNPTHSLKEI